MIVSSIVLCFMLFLVGLFFEKRKLNPVTVFFGEWSLITLLASKNLFNLIPAEKETYSIIFIGCLFWGIGFYLIKLVFKLVYGLDFDDSENLLYKFKNDNTISVNSRFIYMLICVTMLFFFFDFLNSINYLIHGGLNSLRQRAQAGDLYSLPLLNAIRIIIAAPFSLALTTVVAVNFFKKNRGKWFLSLTIIILLERLLSDGGRSPVVYLFFSFLCTYFFINKIHKKFGISKRMFRIRKRSILIFSFIVFCVLSMYLMTLSRSGNNAFRYSYYYFAMEPLMFEKWKNIVDSSGLVAYGMASFNGVIFAFFYVVVNFFGMSKYPIYWRQIYSLIESVGTNWQTITFNGLTANSYSSIFWTFYFDGRLIGVIIGSLFYGAMVSFFYFNALKNPNEKNIAIYVFILIGVFYSFQEFIFENIYYSIAFIMILFFAYHHNNRYEK